MRAVTLELMLVFVAAGAVLDRVAIVVGNNAITEGEVIDELKLEQFVASQPLDVSAVQRRAAADRLVDQQLIRQEMEVARYRQPDPAKADDMLRSFQQQHFPNEADFRAALQRYGITEDQLKQFLLWQLTVIQFTDERFHQGGLPAPEPPDQSANRAAPVATPEQKATPPTTELGNPPSGSADRIVPKAPVAAGGNPVDQQMEDWLKQARNSTRVEFKKEAFQ